MLYACFIYFWGLEEYFRGDGRNININPNFLVPILMSTAVVADPMYLEWQSPVMK